MPALSGRGPFSYDTITISNGSNVYTLVKASYDPTNGETLEVLVGGTKIQGVGLSISGAIISGDLFYVNSLTNPTTISLVTPSTAEVTIRRISNRSTPEVDFAPGSVIRETDLDASTNQTLHVAQEAMDIAISGMVLEANDKFDGKSKVIENVADGVNANDATNVGQFNTHDAAIEALKEDTEDYKLEAGDWAQKVNGAVKVYTDNSVTGSDLGFSAKAHAIGGTDVTGASGQGSAKDWAIGAGGTMATQPDGSEFSAKEYAQGSTATGGTSKEWATNAGSAEVHGGAGYSSKAYAQDTGNNIGSSKDWATLATQVTSTDYSSKQYAVGTPPDGSAKEWAKTTGAVVADSEYSAKEYSQGSTVSTGSAKQWALGGGSFVEGTAVEGSNYSARKYASDASASETAAANSAAAVSQVYDSFNDVYLGSMRTDKSSADAVVLTGASWAKDSSSIAFSGIDTGTVTIGQELTTTGTGYPVDANIIGTQLTTPIVISKPFTVAGTGVTLTFAGTGVYGAFNSSTGGPSLNNDGDALVNGNLYFNSQANEMRIWQGAEWIAATAVGQTSLNEYKFVTNANQIDSGHAAYKTYTGTADVGGTLSYTQDNIIVFMNGVQLKDTTDYTANGTSIVLVAAPVLNDEIAIIAFKSFTTADMVSKTNGGTFAGAVTCSAGLTANTADINGGTIDGVTIGTNSVCTDLRVDNIKIDGNTIISTDTNGNIDLTPNGTGEVNISKVDIDSGTINGCTITGDVSGSAATVTGATQSAITSVGTLTGLTVDSTGNDPLVVKSTFTDGGYVTYQLGASGATIGYLGSAKGLVSSYGAAADAADLSVRSQGELVFSTGGNSERLRIDDAGKVGIGTAAPYSALDIKHTGTDFLGGLLLRASNNNDTWAIVSSGGNLYTGFANDASGADAAADFATKMHLNSSGHLGIGVAPDDSLDVIYSGTNYFNMRLTQTKSTGDQKVGIVAQHYTNTEDPVSLIGGRIISGVNEMYIGGGLSGQNAMQTIGFYTTSGTTTEVGSTRMIIDSAGNVCVGTTVAGIPTTPGHVFFADGSHHLNTAGTANHHHIRFYRGSSIVGKISTTDEGTSYDETSDYRLKENVVPMSGSIDRLKLLKPSRFNFISAANNTVDGFLAHEVQTVVPRAITGEKDAMIDAVLYVEGDELPEGKSIGDVKTAEMINPQGIDYGRLVPLLVGALQETITRIETLENA